MSATIFDVAERAGVSISTVSNALNSPARVSATTREKVLAAVDELGFVPRSQALARARRGTGRIGVIAPLTSYQSFEVRLRGVLDAVRDRKFEVVLFDQASLTVRSDYLSSLPLSDRLDGIIVMSLAFDDVVAERLARREVPAVLVEFERAGFSSVRVDDFHGGRLAAAHLIERGHRSCAFVGEATLAPEMMIDAKSRVDGFRAGLADVGLELVDSHVSLGAYGMESAHAQADSLFDLEDRPTAVFAHSDVQAAGVLRAIADRGWRCPDDVAVVGFDDLDFAAYMGLTTIAQPLRESGRVATELLLSQIASPESSPRQVSLPLTLIERATT
jgi:LacI family transcriptional regulator